MRVCVTLRALLLTTYIFQIVICDTLLTNFIHLWYTSFQLRVDYLPDFLKHTSVAMECVWLFDIENVCLEMYNW